MKQGIHPDYSMTTIQCVCGAKYTVRSTKEIKKIDICSSCHPFFTGKQKFIDTAGRVDRFKARYGKFQQGSEQASEAKAAE